MTNEFKSLSEIPDPPKQPSETVVDREPRRSPPRELVVGGDIKWKPVNREAARLLELSPWYYKPPEPKPTMTTEKRFASHSKIPTDATIVKGSNELEIPLDQGSHSLADGVNNAGRVQIERSEELLRRAQDVVERMHQLQVELNDPWKEFNQWLATELERTRQTRFALEFETRQMMRQFKEVRQFFLEESYTEEIRRLAEFIDICERLKVLSEGGFLDAIADTILKLAR